MVRWQGQGDLYKHPQEPYPDDGFSQSLSGDHPTGLRLPIIGYQESPPTETSSPVMGNDPPGS